METRGLQLTMISLRIDIWSLYSKAEWPQVIEAPAAYAGPLWTRNCTLYQIRAVLFAHEGISKLPWRFRTGIYFQGSTCSSPWRECRYMSFVMPAVVCNMQVRTRNRYAVSLLSFFSLFIALPFFTYSLFFFL